MFILVLILFVEQELGQLFGPAIQTPTEGLARNPLSWSPGRRRDRSLATKKGSFECDRSAAMSSSLSTYQRSGSTAIAPPILVSLLRNFVRCTLQTQFLKKRLDSGPDVRMYARLWVKRRSQT